MLKNNNKGLSLIELIIAFAIFAIAGVAVCSFMIFGTNQFTNANKSVKLQYEQQLVVNRLRDIILETSRGISYDKDTHTLLVFSDNPAYKADATPDPAGGDTPSVNKCLVTQIKFTEGDDESKPGKLYISKDKSIEITETTDFSTIKAGPFDDVEISDSISEFEVVDFEENLKLNKVELLMTFKVGTKEVTVRPVITLRNLLTNVKDGTDLNDVYAPAASELELFSPVAKVEIARDGKVFAQTKTDTIKMAGDGETTSVQYEAYVTKKKTYKEPIDTSVTWSFDLSTLRPGYENCITVSSSGVVTLKKAVVDGAPKSPADYIDGGYFVLVATSNQDNSKSARLRIKADIGGVYPKKITFDGDPVKTQDKINELALYKFKNIIEYTAPIEDPASGAMVNPLTGDGVYTKITYRVDSTKGAVPPTGAGFSITGNVDGVFVATKEMIDKTYCIVATVTQRGQEGQVVEETYMLTVNKDDIPVVDETITMPVLNAEEKGLRGEYLSASMHWSKGVPMYENEWKTKSYYGYSFEWEIEPVESNWHDNANLKGYKLNKLSDLVYFKDNAKNQKLESSSPWDSKRIGMIMIEPQLNWEKSFLFRINVRAKLYEGEKFVGYYRLPGSDEEDLNNVVASDRTGAYVATSLVTIDPVKVTLKPVEVPFYDSNNEYANQIEASYRTDNKIYLSEKYKIKKWFDENGKKVQKEVEITAKDYYKVFEPTFENISVTLLNYSKNIGGVKNILSDNKQNSLQIYTNYPSGTMYVNGRNYTDYTNGLWMNEGHGNQLYVYLKMTPSSWQEDSTGKKPNGARWICIIDDNYGNSVRANFSQADGTLTGDSMNYEFKYEHKK